MVFVKIVFHILVGLKASIKLPLKSTEEKYENVAESSPDRNLRKNLCLEYYFGRPLDSSPISTSEDVCL